MSLLLLLKGKAPPSTFTAAELKAGVPLDSLVRGASTSLFGADWHGIWAGPGIGTPAGWTHAEGDEFSTARWWRYGFPSPAFLGLTFAEPLSEGQQLRLILGDNKLGNSVALKVFWNNPEEYFYALCEEIEGEELEPVLASGFIPRVKGDRFYLSLEEGEDGVRAWRETAGGDPEEFALGTLTQPLEAYGATADIYLLHPGTFRGRDFTAVSLNPEPPIPAKATGKMRVVLNGGGWGGKEPADIAAAVHMVRFDTERGVGHLEEMLDMGLLIHCLFAGPYDEVNGVSGLDPDEWVANALAFYEANLDPTVSPIVEILNEPHGSWFWGEKANSAANALAYRTLVKKAYEGFHAVYGDDSPKIIASVEPVDSWGDRWWEPKVASYLDGVVVHPYGGNDPEEKATSAEGRRREVKEAHQLTGSSLPVYCSEFGWPTAIGKAPTGDSLQWTEAEQAANITAFFNWARSTKYVAECVYFCHHDFGSNTLYGVVDIEGNHKLGYAAIQAQTAIYDRPDTRVAVTREFSPDRLAVRVADPVTGQTIARWAEDEGKAENTIAGITKSGEMSGGHKESGGSLPRDPRIDWPDTETYFDYYLEQPGGENVFEGRINGAPESDGDRMVLEPKAVGHQVALTDRTGLRMGFIDGELSKWGDPSTARRVALKNAKADLVASTSVGFSSKDQEASKPAVINDFSGVVNQIERIEIGEADYYSDGVDIGGLLYDYEQLTSFSEDTNWTSRAALSQTDSFSTYQGGTDHNRTTALQQSLYATVAGLQYALVEDFLADEGEGPLYDITSWQNLKVLSWIAAQNLALRGTWPNVGYTAKQILELAVPLFSYLEAQDEDLEDDGYVIQQAWYSDPGDMATVVKDVLKYGVLRWFVLNGKRFELRAPGTFGRNWQAYAGPSELKEAGIDGSRCWDRQVVSYRDVDGSTRTVGYPGSGADLESAQLQITDPDHPAVRAERPREDLLALGISTPERALEAGERWLREGNELSHAGEATLRGYIQDDCAVFRPVSQIQPGDRIRFPDAGSGGTGYREVVEVNYDHDSRTATVQLDAPSNVVQALLERYGAASSSLALS